MAVPGGNHTVGLVGGHSTGRPPLEGTWGWHGRDGAELITDRFTQITNKLYPVKPLT